MISKKQKKSKKSKKTKKLFIGCHASISPSILSGLEWVKTINGNVIQIFLGNNKSSLLKTKTKLDNDTILNIRDYIRKNNLILFVHSIYLLNFCVAHPNSGKVRYMHENIQYDLHLGNKISAKAVILHLGFKLNLEYNIAITNLINNVNYIITKKPKNIKLLLETSAGIGSQAGYTLSELTSIWNGVKHNGVKNIGICIDTAHIFVSGSNIANLQGIKKYIEDFDNSIGIKNIGLIHLNDSKYSLGSRKDEHRGIGQGTIFNSNDGKESLKYIINFCKKKSIPIILETHGAGSILKENEYEDEIQSILQI